MKGWTQHRGHAVAIPTPDIDTDQLIPARFMVTPRAEGYGQYLLYDARHDHDGNAVDHPLNTSQPTVLVAGRNFGSGSSREAAVYALADFGIRAVVAPSFGDIFAGNAANNGLLPARLHGDDHDKLLALLKSGHTEVAVDLEHLRVTCGPFLADFALPSIWKAKLMNGWDDIDLTRQHTKDIEEFSIARRALAPWSWPSRHET